mmetsp:Transcript_29767/g.63128  ORF Transcript_29767/g.63128 Transcript_29767/m.63128 type:complete len:357 (-) Transcript_29767:36-1106(-)
MCACKCGSSSPQAHSSSGSSCSPFLLKQGVSIPSMSSPAPWVEKHSFFPDISLRLLLKRKVLERPLVSNTSTAELSGRMTARHDCVLSMDLLQQSVFLGGQQLVLLSALRSQQDLVAGLVVDELQHDAATCLAEFPESLQQDLTATDTLFFILLVLAVFEPLPPPSQHDLAAGIFLEEQQPSSIISLPQQSVCLVVLEPPPPLSPQQDLAAGAIFGEQQFPLSTPASLSQHDFAAFDGLLMGAEQQLGLIVADEHFLSSSQHDDFIGCTVEAALVSRGSWHVLLPAQHPALFPLLMSPPPPPPLALAVTSHDGIPAASASLPEEEEHPPPPGDDVLAAPTLLVEVVMRSTVLVLIF